MGKGLRAPRVVLAGCLVATGPTLVTPGVVFQKQYPSEPWVARRPIDSYTDADFVEYIIYTKSVYCGFFFSEINLSIK